MPAPQSRCRAGSGGWPEPPRKHLHIPDACGQRRGRMPGPAPPPRRWLQRWKQAWGTAPRGRPQRLCNRAAEPAASLCQGRTAAGGGLLPSRASQPAPSSGEEAGSPQPSEGDAPRHAPSRASPGRGRRGHGPAGPSCPRSGSRSQCRPIAPSAFTPSIYGDRGRLPGPEMMMFKLTNSSSGESESEEKHAGRAGGRRAGAGFWLCPPCLSKKGKGLASNAATSPTQGPARGGRLQGLRPRDACTRGCGLGSQAQRPLPMTVLGRRVSALTEPLTALHAPRAQDETPAATRPVQDPPGPTAGAGRRAEGVGQPRRGFRGQ